jgi:hypothetical protein
MYSKAMDGSPISTAPNVGASIKKKQEKLYDLCYDYLVENFHKFSDVNKLKVALSLATKMAPAQASVDGNYTVTKMSAVKIEEKTLEFTIGNNRITEATQHSN